MRVKNTEKTDMGMNTDIAYCNHSHHCCSVDCNRKLKDPEGVYWFSSFPQCKEWNRIDTLLRTMEEQN